MASINLNQIMLGGTVGQEPTERSFPDGTAITTLNLTFTTPSKDGETKENYIDVDFFGDRAVEAAAIPIGTEIIVAGTLVRQAWKSKDTDEWRSKHAVRATQLHHNGKPEDIQQQPAIPADDPPF